MIGPLLGKVRAFDRTGAIKIGVDGAMELLRDFRAKYRFVENPESIETLNPDDIFKVHPGEVGEFFHWLEYYLKPIGHLTLYSSVYRRIRDQLEDFKELLHITVDPKKSLAEKVDAPWDRIKGMGYDRHIAKKIIFCFNYEDGDILPIFNTSHLEHFSNEIVDKPSFPAQYVTLGEKYQFLISELLGVKQSLPETQTWELPYFSRFLYDNYPPPRMNKPLIETNEKTRADSEIRNEQRQFREFIELLNELQRKGKLSAGEYRNHGKLWREQPEDRQILVERLRLLLDK